MRYLLIFLLALCTACSSQQIVTKCQHKVEKSKYSSQESVGEAIKLQSQGFNNQKLYIVFAADWCSQCKKLYRLLQDAGIEKKIIFVDVDKTWGFLFSREMRVSGVPTLVILNSNKTIQSREGINKIITYLVANINKKDKDVKLIQN